ATWWHRPRSSWDTSRPNPGIPPKLLRRSPVRPSPPKPPKPPARPPSVAPSRSARTPTRSPWPVLPSNALSWRPPDRRHNHGTPWSHQNQYEPLRKAALEGHVHSGRVG